ncbi:MAG: D-tyrosyl-tRNA(Tyr) deacylase [Prevotellaceae bacterium]|jgi:D-tyrosyl-tRNA(Tyr) deacylase|nr:D-tyrosyl-tRNA(Tyr) deacylase [Prevotellaceae bacterium]
MRLLIQRVAEASVAVNGATKAKMGRGLLVLAGFEEADSEEDLSWGAAKLAHLRIFDDAQGVMNLSLQDVDGEAIIVSQFTLHAQTGKGNRPSYIRAARPEHAAPLYSKLVELVQAELKKPVGTGVFGADMQVSLLNDGPVTIWIDTKQRYY